MAARLIPIEEAAGRSCKDEFPKTYGGEILPRLIEAGILDGRLDGDPPVVADDEVLARVLRLGIEPLVQDRQGYSFVVVRAPIERVAAAPRVRPGVAEYQAKVTPLPMTPDASIQSDETGRRHAFLVQMRDVPDWTAPFRPSIGFRTATP